MFLSYLTLAVALSLSVIAAYYSIAGLTAIFAAAVMPIIIMGGILEIGKVVVTLWLHEYWHRCRFLMKAYLVPAVAVLMLITSMGIFGFLSKAHSDQSMISGDVQAKIAIYDEKIRTERENIDANRRALKQLDEAVDQVMGRSTDEKGADKAVQIRRSQQAERGRLLKEIAESQKRIAALNEERAPIAAEVRKVEAEVGPIKYIAALVYGDSADANLLEAAVRWVIILLVVVFDPLAIMMLLAATESLKWERERRQEQQNAAPAAEPPPAQSEQPESAADNSESQPDQQPQYPPDDGPLSEDQIQQIKHSVNPHPPGWMYAPLQKPVESDPVPEPEPVVEEITETVVEDENLDVSNKEKAAMREWKKANPNDTIKRQRQLFNEGVINQLPWDLGLQADNEPVPAQMRGFGTQWPENPNKGDTFLRVDRLPSALFKYNGRNWIEIDKKLSDQYSYDIAYIDHLIAKLDSGEYDPELLTDAEVDQIQQRIQSRNT